MLLDIQKIDLFAKEAKNLLYRDLQKKYPGVAAYRSVSGFTFITSWDHWIHTLRAHAHGRIHARQIGKSCSYDTPVKREKGSGWTYPLLSKSFAIEIKTLDEQAELLGKEFLKNFVVDVQSDAA